MKFGRKAELEREEVRAVVRSVLKEELKQILEGVARLETAHKMASSSFLQVTGGHERLRKALEDLNHNFTTHSHMVTHDETGEKLPITTVMKDLAELMDVLEAELNTLRVDHNAIRDASAATAKRVDTQDAYLKRVATNVAAAFALPARDKEKT